MSRRDEVLDMAKRLHDQRVERTKAAVLRLGVGRAYGDNEVLLRVDQAEELADRLEAR